MSQLNRRKQRPCRERTERRNLRSLVPVLFPLPNDTRKHALLDTLHCAKFMVCNQLTHAQHFTKY